MHMKPKLDINIDSAQDDKEVIDGYRIMPTIVLNQTLRNMRYESACHILKGTVAKCEGCGQRFTTSKLI